MRVAGQRWLAAGWLLSAGAHGVWGADPSSSSLDPATWPVPSAIARFRLERSPGSPWPATVGTVTIWPCKLKGAYVSAFTAEGRRVGVESYWSSGDDPSKFHLDTSSGATAYDLYYSREPGPPLGGWKPEAGVLLETRNCRNLPVERWEDFRRALGSSTVTYGRTHVPNVFLGLNPEGPSYYYSAVFSGFFMAPKDGVYEFATASDDASYLEVNGRMVAQWLGRHGPHGGLYGEHKGKVQLSAGRNRLEYVHIQLDGGAAALAAWKPPGQERFEVMPPSAFLPVARLQVTGFTPAEESAPPAYAEWESVEHCVAGESALVKVKLAIAAQARGRRTGHTYRWTFDDGAIAEGTTVQHLFPRPGRRSVNLEVWQGGSRVGTNTWTINVEPRWEQLEEWRPSLYDEFRRALLSGGLRTMPTADLVGALQLANRELDRELVAAAAPTLVKRAAEASSLAPAALWFDIGLTLEHQGDTGAALARTAFQSALNRSAAKTALHERAKLHLAEHLLNSADQAQEALALLNSVVGALLEEAERRQSSALIGEALFAQGKTDEARRWLAGLGTKGAKQATEPGLGLTARLEAVELLAAKQDWESAAAALDHLQAEVPISCLSVDAGLVRIRLALEQKENHRAFVLGRRLAPLAEGHRRAGDLLLALAQAGFAIGRTNEATAAAERLVREFPNSEPAAKAKAEWRPRVVRASR